MFERVGEEEAAPARDPRVLLALGEGPRERLGPLGLGESAPPLSETGRREQLGDRGKLMRDLKEESDAELQTETQRREREKQAREAQERRRRREEPTRSS